MEFKSKHSGSTLVLTGQKNYFHFAICASNPKFVVVEHMLSDIRFNTLWEKITFDSLDDAKQWCENFKPENHSCIGNDVKKHKTTFKIGDAVYWSDNGQLAGHIVRFTEKRDVIINIVSGNQIGEQRYTIKMLNKFKKQ